ncbi:MAG TPA: hypothetical protein VGB18_00965, partial [Candidatus Thermoplasmatota archaeon]
MRTALILAMSIILSGCLTENQAPRPTPDPGVIPAAFTKPMLVGRGGDAETSHIVSPDGSTILICSHGGFTQPSPLWVWEDGGSSFRQLFPSPSPPLGGDCDLAFGSDGSWYMIYDTLASITVTGTSDKGA